MNDALSDYTYPEFCLKYRNSRCIMAPTAMHYLDLLRERVSYTMTHNAHQSIFLPNSE